jgi:hypothetical protein
LKELFEQLADMCSAFQKRLRINGFSRREALKLTQTFINATLNKPAKSKEEN